MNTTTGQSALLSPCVKLEQRYRYRERKDRGREIGRGTYPTERTGQRYCHVGRTCRSYSESPCIAHRATQSLCVVGLTAQLFSTGPGLALSVAQTVLASSCIIGMFAVILRMPFCRDSGDAKTAISNSMGYISIWLTIVGIVVLTWVTQDRVVAVIATVVFAFCFCIAAESELHVMSGKPERA